jgi:hypothetical protein
MSRSNPLKQIQQLWAKLGPEERKAHLEWTLHQCATCGREGEWKGGGVSGEWCDACCEKGILRTEMKPKIELDAEARDDETIKALEFVWKIMHIHDFLESPKKFVEEVSTNDKFRDTVIAVLTRHYREFRAGRPLS